MWQLNLGETNFRVPDGGLNRPGAGGVLHATAAVVVEIVSPEDEAWEKLPFFAAHHVDGVVIVRPAEQTVSRLGLRDADYEPVEGSGLIQLGPTVLARRTEWP